jgi:hypothetical protein
MAEEPTFSFGKFRPNIKSQSNCPHYAGFLFEPITPRRAATTCRPLGAKRMVAEHRELIVA